jgi:hypothetical protein
LGHTAEKIEVRTRCLLCHSSRRIVRKLLHIPLVLLANTAEKVICRLLVEYSTNISSRAEVGEIPRASNDIRGE